MDIKSTQDRAFANVVAGIGEASEHVGLLPSRTEFVQKMATRQAIFEATRLSSRKTVVLLTASSILSLFPEDYEGSTRGEPVLPAIEVGQASSGEDCVVALSGSAIGQLRKMKDTSMLVPVEIAFSDSPGRTDDGLWNIMTSPPRSITGMSGATIPLPEPMTGADQNGIDHDMALSIGASSDAIYAVMSFTPRCPLVSDNPAGNEAETWASARDADRLMNMGSDKVMKKAVDFALAEKLGNELVSRVRATA